MATNPLAKHGLPNLKTWEPRDLEDHDELKDQKFHNPKDQEAYGREFELFARHSAPFHVQIELPYACVNITKSEYDLLMSMYLDALAFWEHSDTLHPSSSPLAALEAPSSSLPLDDVPQFPSGAIGGDDVSMLRRLSDDNPEFEAPSSDTDSDGGEMFYSVVEEIDYAALRLEDDAVVVPLEGSGDEEESGGEDGAFLR